MSSLLESCCPDNALFYLDKAVELCDYDGALVVRSRQEDGETQQYQLFTCLSFFRCHYMFGHYQESITDAQEALRINVDSVSARGCLGINLL